MPERQPSLPAFPLAKRVIVAVKPLLKQLQRLCLTAMGSMVLVSCSTLGLETKLIPGRSQEADVIALLGAPVRRWREPDGSQTLEYSRQPWGTQCLMARLDASGRWVGMEDVLLPAGRARIQPGLSTEQVSHGLGQERSRIRYALSGEEVWDWTIRSDTPGYGLRFNVHFKDGKVVRTTESMVFFDRRRGAWDD